MSDDVVLASSVLSPTVHRYRRHISRKSLLLSIHVINLHTYIALTSHVFTLLFGHWYIYRRFASPVQYFISSDQKLRGEIIFNAIDMYTKECCNGQSHVALIWKRTSCMDLYVRSR